jgi:hypothetical protein
MAAFQRKSAPCIEPGLQENVVSGQVLLKRAQREAVFIFSI